MLRSFIFAHVFCYAQLCHNHRTFAFKHVSLLILECLKSKWNHKQVAKCLLARNFRYKNSFLELVVYIGELLHKVCDTKALFQLANTSIAITSDMPKGHERNGYSGGVQSPLIIWLKKNL